MRISKWILAGLLMGNMAMAATTGAPAPDFTAHDSKGKTVKLSDYKGKTVVLEWLNYGCPFIKKHYGSGNMQALQAEAEKKGVVWLSVISSAKGKQGASTPASAEKDKAANKSNATDVILDSDGAVAKAFSAKTTPHMFVIDAKGNIAYQGAIDDKPSADQADVKIAHNYVRDAIDAVTANPPKAVKVAETTPYGCSVKY
ncbi:MAG: thioredoxin family protein [Bdellovibrionota bacterium]